MDLVLILKTQICQSSLLEASYRPAMGLSSTFACLGPLNCKWNQFQRSFEAFYLLVHCSWQKFRAKSLKPERVLVGPHNWEAGEMQSSNAVLGTVLDGPEPPSPYIAACFSPIRGGFFSLQWIITALNFLTFHWSPLGLRQTSEPVIAEGVRRQRGMHCGPRLAKIPPWGREG